ncbi:MAG: tRNA (adenosine(37)-N6)-threonylcarbamoyltransferase complex transferase subunit TsaD [Elusimicrobia bacterium]|nr:tRNA (adenosine(37)-N6)-threonylcarbamoyltransferase complex transferase subunit TsaD [Elusimicrobiota bacterium]
MILGIETSCDETAVGIIESKGYQIRAAALASQIPLHAPYFGVVPELASRAHLEKIFGVLSHCLKKARIKRPQSQIEAVAYTRGPGLKGALLIGETVARSISQAWKLPAIGVHHLEAHLACTLIEYPRLKTPFLGLIVSGGHTDLVVVKEWGHYRVLGRTLDDACGEAFDKFAKMLKLGYPGGPLIDKLARQGDARAIRFPRPLMESSWDFSFSGLKTSALYWLRDHGRPATHKGLCDLAASFQEAICDTLIFKTKMAMRRFGLKTLVVSGGVAANSRLRRMLLKASHEESWRFFVPSAPLCTDNGAMIGVAGCLRLKAGGRAQRAGAVDSSLPFPRWA